MEASLVEEAVVMVVMVVTAEVAVVGAAAVVVAVAVVAVATDAADIVFALGNLKIIIQITYLKLLYYR